MNMVAEPAARQARRRIAVKHALPKGVGKRFVEQMFEELCECINTPVSLGAYLRYKAGEHEQLVRMEINPLHYLDPHSFFKDYQAISFLAKYPHLRTGIDTRRVAMQKFIEAEDQCLETNERFRRDWESPSNIQKDVAAVLHIAARKISLILGNVPSLDALDFRFGPGANLSTRGETSVYNKLTADLEATASMLPILPDFLGEFPGWIQADVVDVKLVNGSELTFVPKNAKTDRPICIEPLLNGLYQKGIGSYIRKRLHRHGVRLDDQTVNQKLASKSIELGLATIDLSSASDCISYNLVLDLLPEEWFDFLEVARCGQYFIEGNWYSFQKFTSMGNAYTFELETLIFYSLTTAVMEHLGIKNEVGVYGDDIIVDARCSELLLGVLGYCGFSVNKQKTFTSGPFRESCGSDYFLGCDVRPFFSKKRVTKLTELYYYANTISRIAKKHSLTERAIFSCGQFPIGVLPEWCLPIRRSYRYRDLYDRVVGNIPRSVRYLGPDGYGDGHLISDLDQACPPRARNGHDGWKYISLRERPVKRDRGEWPQAYSLYYAGLDAEASKGYDVRGRCRITKVVTHAPYWGTVGCWN